MIRVTVELCPGGDVTRARHLGTAIIANTVDSADRKNIGNYAIMLSKRGRPTQAWKRGRVEGFPRQRRGAWDLLYRALEATVGQRN